MVRRGSFSMPPRSAGTWRPRIRRPEAAHRGRRPYNRGRAIEWSTITDAGAHEAPPIERNPRCVAARARAIEGAAALAADVPLRTARVAREVLELARRIAPMGNRNAVSDAGVAALLTSAAIRGAVLNVRINLPQLPEGAPLQRQVSEELPQLEADAAALEAAALADVSASLG